MLRLYGDTLTLDLEKLVSVLLRSLSFASSPAMICHTTHNVTVSVVTFIGIAVVKGKELTVLFSDINFV